MRTKKRNGYTLVEVLIVVIILFFGVGGVTGYVSNIFKLVRCDFASPYKAEVIHGVGVFLPPVGAVAGYINIGK